MSAAALRSPAPQPVARMHCHSTRGERLCGRFLGYPQSEVTFVQVAERAPATPDGLIWVKCQDCKAWNAYEAVRE